MLGGVSHNCRCNFLLVSHFFYLSNVAALQDTAIDIVCLRSYPHHVYQHRAKPLENDSTSTVGVLSTCDIAITHSESVSVSMVLE